MNEETCACCPYHFTAEIQRGSTCRNVLLEGWDVRGIIESIC